MHIPIPQPNSKAARRARMLAASSMIVTALWGMPTQAQTPKQTEAGARQLPKQELTYDIASNQIISDLAAYRGKFDIAFEGYMQLAQTTRDPRYAERAFMVASLAKNQQSVLVAMQLLQSLDSSASLSLNSPGLRQFQTLSKILKKAESGQVQAAYADAQTFLRNHPDHIAGWTLAADLANRLKREDDVLRAFEQLYRLEPNNAEAMNNLGYFLAEHNIRLNEAEALLTRALKLSPNAAHIIDSAAWLAYRQKQLPQALKLARAAYKQTAQPDIALHLAEILWANGEQAQAQKLLQQVRAEIDNDNTEFMQQLADTFKRLGISSTQP